MPILGDFDLQNDLSLNLGHPGNSWIHRIDMLQEMLLRFSPVDLKRRLSNRRSKRRESQKEKEDSYGIFPAREFHWLILVLGAWVPHSSPLLAGLG